ncbi:MAG TPA: hypothetical protein VHN56_07785, partial [Actinomycetota bacterium]|nr:hypothetical protein [Actinomycetota bacterium]
TISLTRTTTLAAYHNGVEHYITSFEYAGKTSGDVGSIIPLPGIPSKVIKGGGWTLQRLVLETNPPIFATDGVVAASAAPERAVVILKTKIDSLDVTVLKGGAVAVGTWATQHGFFLPPDAVERRSSNEGERQWPEHAPSAVSWSPASPPPSCSFPPGARSRAAPSWRPTAPSA